MTTTACVDLEPQVGIARACALTGRSRATRYRRLAGPRHGPPRPRPTPPNAGTTADARTGARVVLGSATQPVDVRAAPTITGTTAARLGWGGPSAARVALFLGILVAAGTAAALALRGRPQRG